MRKGKYEAKRAPAANMAIWLAIVLFWLVIITTYMTSGLYAKYATMDSGSDSARVITFGDLTLKEEGSFYEAGKLMIIPGVDLQKKATVDFEGSEAATYVFVEAELSGNWALSADQRTFILSSGGKTIMQWRVDGEWTYLPTGGTTYVFYRSLIPNTELNGADIVADNGKITVSENITRHEIGGLTGISIVFRAAVVQSGGFDDAGAAWASLASKEG